LDEKSEAIALVLWSLMAGWLADEIVLDLKIFKIIYQMNFVMFKKGTVLL